MAKKGGAFFSSGGGGQVSLLPDCSPPMKGGAFYSSGGSKSPLQYTCCFTAGAQSIFTTVVPKAFALELCQTAHRPPFGIHPMQYTQWKSPCAHGTFRTRAPHVAGSARAHSAPQEGCQRSTLHTRGRGWRGKTTQHKEFKVHRSLRFPARESITVCFHIPP